MQNGDDSAVVENTYNTDLSEAEQRLVDTPDSELTPEQRAVKQTILERQQKNITRNGDVGSGNVANLSERKSRSKSEKANTLRKSYERERNIVSAMSSERQQYLKEKHSEYDNILKQLEIGDKLISAEGDIIGEVVAVQDGNISIVGEEFSEIILNDSFTDDGIISFLETGGSFDISIKKQINANLEKLNNMRIVASLDLETYPTDKHSIMEWILNRLSELKSNITRIGFGEIVFDKKRIKNGFAYKKTNSENIAVLLVPQVLENGVDIYKHPNHKERGYGTTTFAAPIEINGHRGNMAVVVRQEGENYYKVHRVLTPDGSQFNFYEKRDTAETAGQVQNKLDVSPTDNISKDSIPDLKEKVNKFRENSDTDYELSDNDQDTNAQSALASPSSNTKVPQKVPGVKTIISNSEQNNTQADSQRPANFMPDGENEGEVGLSEPSVKEIHRDPTSQEENEAIFGKRKDAKQRHILDVAKKLDSNMTVVFVDPDSDKLSGEKGAYWHDTNTIYLSTDNSVVGMYCQIFKHEFVHRLESKKAYQGFKNYLFNQSSAFERYIRAELKRINGADFDGTREEAIKALSDHYIDLVKKSSFTEEYKRNFTAEYAEREMVANFVGKVLFKGKENIADVAQNLSDGEIEKIISLEDTFAEFENLNETERGWFQRIIDSIKDFIASLKGIKQNERLVNDLEYIEQRLARVLDSKDTKKAASRAVDRQYSLKIIHTDGSIDELSDARSLTDEQAIDYLKKAKSGKLKWDTYIPIRKDTPQTIIDTLKGAGEIIENRSLVMQVRKAQQAMSSNNKGGKSTKPGSNIRKHALSPNEIIEIINNLDNPNTVILQTNRYNQNGKALPNNVAIFVEYSNNGKEGVAVVEFGSSIDSEFIGTEFGDTNYHTVVTIFEPDTERQGIPFDYVEELLENPNNFELKIERRQSERSDIGKKRPNTSSELPSIDSVPHEVDTVNSNSMQEAEDYSQPNGEIKQSFALDNPIKEETDGPDAEPSTPNDKPTERFIKTIIETGTLNDEMLEGMHEKLLLGDFSYEVMSDKAALEKAEKTIEYCSSL